MLEGIWEQRGEVRKPEHADQAVSRWKQLALTGHLRHTRLLSEWHASGQMVGFNEQRYVCVSTKQKAAPDERELAWHPQLSLLLGVNNFTEHQQQTGPLCHREGARQKQDHSTSISDTKIWPYQPKDIVQTTKGTKHSPYPLRGQVLKPFLTPSY